MTERKQRGQGDLSTLKEISTHHKLVRAEAIITTLVCSGGKEILQGLFKWRSVPGEQLSTDWNVMA